MKAIYACPMHPQIKQNSPGLCPECGMNLLLNRSSKAIHGDAGQKEGNHGKNAREFDKHAGHSTGKFALKFWISLALTIPVILITVLNSETFGLNFSKFSYFEYLPVILSSFVFFYGGSVFLLGSFRELRARLPGMMTLIALAISTAYIYSLAGFFFFEGEALFWELTSLVTIMLLGHLLEMKSVQGAQKALKELSKLIPDTAELVISGKDHETRIVRVFELKVGDIVLARPGSRIPADGIITEGASHVDESLLTGESKPVSKSVGSEVVAGSLNGDGSLKIQVMKIGESTFLSGVMRLVSEAQSSKSKLQMLSDKAAYFLTIVAIISSIATFLAWLSFGSGTAFAIERLVAVLVIACPHALGLAIPLVASISTTLAARNGLLVRERLALEAARKIDIVLFDKTGTLTKGEFGVVKILVNSDSEFDEGELLKIAASVDSRSEHFIAKAISKFAESKNIDLFEVRGFERLPGRGVKAQIEGKEILVGGAGILEINDLKIPDSLNEEINKFSREGATIIFVILGGVFLGVIALADLIREESREAIQNLEKLGVNTAIVTGDSEDVAKWVARETGVGQYFARVMPHEKAEIVKKMQNPMRQLSGESQKILSNSKFNLKELYERGFGISKKRVAFVGDGINDAPALTQADLGVAIGAGTNVAIESAGIILVKNDPRDIAKIFKLSKLTYKKMIQNLFWATGYNVIALPLAAGVLASRGIILEPALSAVFMSLSTIIVAVNAMMLRKTKLES